MASSANLCRELTLALVVSAGGQVRRSVGLVTGRRGKPTTPALTRCDRSDRPPSRACVVYTGVTFAGPAALAAHRTVGVATSADDRNGNRRATIPDGRAIRLRVERWP